jgi:acyl carrier protein
MTSALTQDLNAAVIQAEIAKLFTEVLHVDVQSTTTDLLDTGILDSQKFVELLLHLEQKFELLINIQDFEIENFSCIEKIATFVAQRVAESRSGSNCLSHIDRRPAAPSQSS